MKKFFLIGLVCLIIGSCGKENPEDPENKTFVCECTYENICLDTIQWGNAKLEDILGKWHLNAFVDMADCNITPVLDEPQMTVVYSNNNKISGNTISNHFEGEFLFDNGKIVFSNIESTEIVEPELGSRFIQALLVANNVFLTSDKLFLKSKDVLVFSKTKSLQDKTVSLFEKCTMMVPQSYTIIENFGDDSHTIEVRSSTQDIVVGFERAFDFEYDTLYEFVDDKEHVNVFDSEGNEIGVVAYTNSKGGFRDAFGTFWLKEDTYYLNLVNLSFSKTKLFELQNILSTIKK